MADITPVPQGVLHPFAVFAARDDVYYAQGDGLLDEVGP